MTTEEYETAIGRLVLLKEITTHKFHEQIDDLIQYLVDEKMKYNE